MYTWILVFFTVFLKNRNISSKIKRSKVTDYATLNRLIIGLFFFLFSFSHSKYERHSVGLRVCTLSSNTQGQNDGESRFSNKN